MLANIERGGVNTDAETQALFDEKSLIEFM